MHANTLTLITCRGMRTRAHTHTNKQKCACSHVLPVSHPWGKVDASAALQAALGESQVVTQQSDNGARRAGGKKVEVGFGGAGRGSCLL